jgi:hyperosmotically inducible protein
MQTFPRLCLCLCLALPVVLPATLVNDRQIETLARTSFALRTVLEGRVKVSADFGVLTLTGTVEDEADRLLAGDTVALIPGMGGVENKLVVRVTHREQSDPWIARNIHRRLRVSRGLSAAVITVAVEDAMVTLTGTVGAVAARELAGRVVGEITGGKHVRNNLVVADAVAAGTPVGELVDDASVSAMVSAALLGHADTRRLGPGIATAGGVVRITGAAKSDVEKALVTRLVREVHGVRSVNNELKVKD